MAGWTMENQQPIAPPNRFLTAPTLFVSGVQEAVPDSRIVEVLYECLRLRPVIERRTGSMYAEATGYVEFESIERAEKAYASANPSFLPDYNCTLHLHHSPPPCDEPIPTATPRVFKSLPDGTTSGALFDLCRPFGPIHRVTLQYSPAYPLGSGPPVFSGQAIVSFYDEADAQSATDGLHCTEFGRTTIMVQPYQAARARKSDVQPQWANAAAFVPSGGVGYGHPNGGLNAIAPTWTPGRTFSNQSQNSIHSTGSISPSSSFNSSTGLPQHLLPAKSGAAIDPCNLFIKSLDPSITSQDLYAVFGPFGAIVSARVMRDDRSGVSKEFGFVSYQRPEEAAAALVAMDGQPVVGATGHGRNVVVRLHEPKRFREGRMREKYGVEDVASRMSNLSTTGDSPDHSPQGSVYDSRQGSTDTSVPSSPPAVVSPEPATTLPERERLVAAVAKLNPAQAEEIVGLLMGLPKKERAMCLFNPEHLNVKVADALNILSSDSDDEEASPAGPTPASSLPTPASTPKTKAAPPRIVPAVPASFADLARLPVVDIVALVQSADLSSLGVTRVEREKEEATDEFMDALEAKWGGNMQKFKETLGERVFKAIKSVGVKGAPKITIHLLDTEDDLRLVAHLADYPEVIKERVAVRPVSK